MTNDATTDAPGPRTLARKLIDDHLVEGTTETGEEIALRIDQTLTQDATGTMVMLELEALGIDRVSTEVSVQYVDHNLLQTDERNPEDHAFLQSACKRFGVWFSRPGNGVSHPVHQAHFGVPGRTLIGSDSHTCAAGALGMLAIGVGGLDVAMAMAGESLYVQMPEIWGVELTGSLPDWVSAKDVILEMLRRNGVSGGVGRIIEYHGDGLAELTAMDRHVIANMGAELGATATVFPSDDVTEAYLASVGRADDFVPLAADDGAAYDVTDSIDLGELVPLIAKPSSPGNVVPVSDVEGEEVNQVVVGSSANPGLRDFAVLAETVRGRRVSESVSLDVNPTSREVLSDLVRGGWMLDLVAAGARLHQTGCLGCIGMGQAPANGTNSLRTMPRNFPGRSGAHEDAVWLCSPETAAAAALTGVITDPRSLDLDHPRPDLPSEPTVNSEMLIAPLPQDEARDVTLVKGENIVSLPDFEPLPDSMELPIILVAPDDTSTDEILPAGGEVLPLRSNIPKIAEYAFSRVDAAYAEDARAATDGHVVVGGRNYGQGSSREHAAIAPRYLGLRAVIATSYARIHWQNLANFGILPLELADPDDAERLAVGGRVTFDSLHEGLSRSRTVTVDVDGVPLELRHRLSPRQVEMVLAGGRIPQHAAAR